MTDPIADRPYLTPPQFARLLAIRVEKVIDWIHSGELRASNVAANPNGLRPRWRIPREEVQRFLLLRSNAPAPPPLPKRKPRRRKAPANSPEWF